MTLLGKLRGLMANQSTVLPDIAAAQAGFGWCRKDRVQPALEQSGVWEDYVEWRISTTTHLRLEKIRRSDRDWYKVLVECDQTFSCECPTLDRALEFTNLYCALGCMTFSQLGWPSWASRSQLMPPA